MAAPAKPRTSDSRLEQAFDPLPPEEQRIRRKLFAAARTVDVRIGERRATVGIIGAARADAGESVELRSRQNFVRLAVTQHAGQHRLGERDWSEYRGDSRLLAWCLAHEELLEYLQALFGQPLFPQRLHAGFDSGAAETAAVTVGFTVASDAGDPLYAGRLRLPLHWADRLVARSAAAPAGRPIGVFAAMPVNMQLRLAGPRLRSRQLDRIGQGDTIICGQTAAAFGRIRLCGPRGCSLHAAFDSGGLRITSHSLAEPDAVPEVNEMELENIESAATETPESWSSIPVALEFDVGTLTMSLDDVTKLQPGYAFVLEAPAAGTNVRIRANGVVVGQGQLVIVGETLGVNVTRWSDNGFQ